MQRHRYHGSSIAQRKSGVGKTRWTEMHSGIVAEPDALRGYAQQAEVQPPASSLVMIEGRCPGACGHSGQVQRNAAQFGWHSFVIPAIAGREIRFVADSDGDAAAVTANAGNRDDQFGRHDRRGQHGPANRKPATKRQADAWLVGASAPTTSLSRLSAAIQPDIRTIGMPGPGWAAPPAR